MLDDDNARVQIFDSGYQFINQFGTQGVMPGQFSHPTGITLDSTGNIYVSDTLNSRVQKFDSQGKFLTAWGRFGMNNEDFIYPMGLVTDLKNNIYVIDFGSEYRSTRIQIFSATGQWLESWDLGKYNFGRGDIRVPNGIAFDHAGFFYVVDRDNHRVLKLDSSGNLVLTFGGRGYGNELGYFEYPTGVTVDKSGNVYVVDTGNLRIQKLNSLGYPLAAWGGGNYTGMFYNPIGIASSDDGFIYVADTYANSIKKIDADGNLILKWGEKGRASGQFDDQIYFDLDNQGSLYVLDSVNFRVQVFDSYGKYLKSWEAIDVDRWTYFNSYGIDVSPQGEVMLSEATYKYDTQSYISYIHVFTKEGKWLRKFSAPGSDYGLLSRPEDIVSDTEGNIYVNDNGNNRINKYTFDGVPITSWGNEGKGLGELNNPVGIGIDSMSNVYVVDGNNYRVQKFTNGGTWLRQWKTTGYPSGVAIGKNSMLYVTQNGDQTITQHSQDNTRSRTIADSGPGIGEFVYPREILFSPSGLMYVGDDGNRRIQILRPMTYTRPIATITNLNAASLGQSDTLTVRGLGQDSDETGAIAGYEWRSDKDGVIGDAAVLTRAAKTMSPGTHRISLRVRDGEGEWSDPVSEIVYVAPEGRPAWTMLLYLAGDYADRGQLLNAFNSSIEALRRQFRNPNLRIAVQIDGPANGDTRRLLISPGTAFAPAEIAEVPVGEQAMDSPETLVDFIRWGQSSFPADHYYLSIADHGQGIQGTAWDTTSAANGSAYLTVRELGQALSATDVAPIDVLHLDSCSMDLIEVAYEVRQKAGVLIASQYLGWSYFAYADYQAAFSASTSAADVARGITTRYAALTRAGSKPFTIAALDLRRAEPMRTAVDNLSAELAALVVNNQANKSTLDGIRAKSRTFESNGDFDDTPNDEYVDLLDWASRIQREVSSPAVKQRAAELIAELTGPQPFVLTSEAQSNTLPSTYKGAYIDLTNSYGVSIFYPQNQVTVAFDSYINDRLFIFTAASRWPEFLLAGVATLSPGAQLEALPGPLEPLGVEQRVYLPLTAN